MEVGRPDGSLHDQLQWFYANCYVSAEAGCQVKKDKKQAKRIPKDRRRLFKQSCKIKNQLTNCTNDESRKKFTDDIDILLRINFYKIY